MCFDRHTYTVQRIHLCSMVEFHFADIPAFLGETSGFYRVAKLATVLSLLVSELYARHHAWVAQ
jgi:hypothetical protein